MTIEIRKDESMAYYNFPFIWIIKRDGTILACGYSVTEKEAVKAACACYFATHKWED